MVAWVHEVIVENFKSYEGRVRVGPFRKFTCVVGPNGAGKSNLMDAISFVLGMRGRHLRSERLLDLVHRKDGETAEGNKRVASVELLYKDAGSTAARTEEAATILFRREIQPESPTLSHYQVNGEVVSEQEYSIRLEAINILSKARNFLVFQGDVEAAAQRQGKELTNFLEQVSGSLAYRDEYEALAKEKAQKEDFARCLYTKRRNVVNEKKRLGQQTAEAHMYREKEIERRQLEVEFYLFQFHLIAWQAEDAGRRSEDAERGQSRLRSEAEQTQAEMSVAERSQGQIRLEVTQAVQAQSRAREGLGSKDEATISVRERLAFVRQKVQDLKLQREKESAKGKELEGQRDQLQSELEKQRLELGRLAEESGKAPLFTPEQQERFRQAQSRAERATSSDCQRARDLDAQVRLADQERARVEHELREAEATCRGLEQRIKSLVESEAATSAAVERVREQSGKAGKQLKELQSGMAGHEQRKEELQAERSGIMQDIQNITAHERQIKQEQRCKRVSEELKQLVPGVRGRILELCTPVSEQFHVAINVALGGFIDAVVTDTRESSKRCIQCLKERFLDPMTFLPLDNLRGQPPNPKLAEAVRNRSGFWLATKCIRDRAGCDRAFEFLLGDVVFAASLPEGRRFVFEELKQKGLSCRLVTLDGETISRDGNMGINAEAARHGATRFDFTGLADSRGKLEDIDRQLNELHAKGSTGTSHRMQLQEEKSRLEARLREGTQALERCREDLAQQRARLSESRQAAEAARPQAQRLREDLGRLQEEQRKLEKSIDRTVAVHFADIGQEMGVADIRGREREWRQERERSLAAEGRAAQQLSGMEAELKMVRQSLGEQESRGTADALARCQKEIRELTDQKNETAGLKDTAMDDAEASEKHLKACQDKESAVDKEAAVKRRGLRQAADKLAEAENEVSSIAAELRGLHDRRQELLRRSVLEDVDVPLLGGGGREALQDAVAAAGDEGPQPSVAQGGGAAAVAAAAAAEEVEVDLSQLPDEKRGIPAGPAATMLQEEYRSELRRLAAEIAKMRPNLRAGEQLCGAEERADGAAAEAAVAHRDVEDIDGRFEAVRLARRELFMSCFKKVAEEINNIYGMLTGSARAGQDGGSAYLDLEDLENPFNGAVKFSTRPPAKRFSDVSLLSGGERTLAAMALLFALQAYQRPPFLVLDEIDAYLDPRNVQALSRYMQQVDCQTIVISLKDRLFSRSQGLVGISKDKSRGASVVLTLDLDRVREATARRAGSAPLPPAPVAAG